MKPKDMAKKKFKLIPGADYEGGPISKYGTFGNMIKQRTTAGLKKSADAMTMDLNKLKGENIEQITDLINPVRGMFVPAAKAAKGVFSDTITKRMMKWVDDSKAELNSPAIFAMREEGKYFPRELYGLRGAEYTKRQDELVQQYKDELSTLTMADTKKAEELNNKIDWTKNREIMLEELTESGPTTYGEAMKHDKLFEEMPELRDLPFSYSDTDEYLGAFFGDSGKLIELKRGKRGTAGNAKVDTMLHEVQHSIQNSAGWPRGGNPDEFAKQYKRDMDRLDKVVAAMENKYLKMPAGPEKKAYEQRVWRAQYLRHQRPTPYEKYKSLYGEQQARAVQKQFNDPTSKNFITGEIREKEPWANLRLGEGTEVIDTKHFGRIGKLPDALIKYRKNGPIIGKTK